MTSPSESRRLGPETEPVPCRSHPDRWFDPAHCRGSLAACLACPRRRDCSQWVLTCQPSWGCGRASGSTAGPPPRRHCCAPLPKTALVSPRVPARATPPPRTLAPPPAGLPASSPTGVQHAGEEDLAPGALIFARSEGYCELMVADCRVMARAIASRVPNHGGGDASTSTQFAVCEECAITLRRTDHLLVQRLGYRVEHAPSAVSTPFLWRQQQRVLRDAGGGLHSTARRSTTSPSCRDRIGGRTARAVRGGARASPPQCARNVAERAASKIA